MTPGRPDARVVERHLIALHRTLAFLRRHADISNESLSADTDRRLAIERGLQLCAQNALDIAGHISSALGFDHDSYGSSIDALVEAEVLTRRFGHASGASPGSETCSCTAISTSISTSS